MNSVNQEGLASGLSRILCLPLSLPRPFGLFGCWLVEDHMCLDPLNNRFPFSALMQSVEAGAFPIETIRIIPDKVRGDISGAHEVHAQSLDAVIYMPSHQFRASVEWWLVAVVPFVFVSVLTDEVLVSCRGQFFIPAFGQQKNRTKQWIWWKPSRSPTVGLVGSPGVTRRQSTSVDWFNAPSLFISTAKAPSSAFRVNYRQNDCQLNGLTVVESFPCLLKLGSWFASIFCRSC